ncbi:EAL domain-containing protein [Conexibacter sp. JD483]|uniref:putative bifunctional diguanylate cyclase/phosphodiesterase n=1 Tax=unclassified Conexibacter TaxID=2627773 RepID=UPI002716FCCF|nr:MULTISPECIES: EAL domain-containing protein [unclassified Conexibacter]MDO8186713.1 EAL domain-containing protein [Conexibacter sp. CPCC 205706]MDO8198999.1 EAL domain-containing protein [Conexibacter sp. CPCC 205762]MDR9368451.1 EAL domain-containing protein [Conexibacter sp. JD483]
MSASPVNMPRSDRYFRALLEYAGDAIVVCDAGGRIVIANEETERLFGYAREELIGEPIEVLLPHAARERHVAHRDAFMETHARRAMGRHLALHGLRRDGSRFPIEVSLGPLDEGGERLVAAIVRDVSERLRMEQELRRLADRDELTGLYNRRRFTLDLDRLIAAEETDDAALLLIDLDNFKYVNDTLGHNAGDAVIRAAAERLRGLIRSGDVLARLGGDEFVVLLPGASLRGATQLAERIVSAFERGPAGGGEPVTASVGVTTFGGRDRIVTGEQLLAEADIAMYSSKEAGRNRVALYGRDTGSPTRMQDDLSLANRLNRALTGDGLELFAQPVVAVGEDAPPRRFELLLRLRGADGELHSPAVFLPLSERFGLARRIDRWVIAESLRLAAVHPAVAELAINLSATSLADADLADHIAAGTRTAGVDPGRLLFEITETAAITNSAAAEELARRLRAFGCRLALDDFGTGFGTFTTLRRLPFDALKIDGSFIRGLCDSEADQVIVRSLVDVAHGLGKLATAEWVEDERTLTALRDYGVDFAQGYHLGRPRPADEVFAELS